MHAPLIETLAGWALLAGLWWWVHAVAWSGMRSQRRVAWLRPGIVRRLRRAARRKDRAVDREIVRLLREEPRRRDAPQRAAPEPEHHSHHRRGRRPE